MSRGLPGVRLVELPVDTRGQDDELAALAGRARAGNAEAFNTLAKRVYDRVRRWAKGVTRDSDDAEDVAQLVLLRLHASIDQFEGRSRFTTWLYRMTRNTAFNRVQLERRRNALLEKRVPELIDDATNVAAPERPADDLHQLVHFYMHELPVRQREVFELGDLRGLNSVEIAERLDITPSTARGLLMKARRRIRLRMLESHADLLEEYTP